MEIKGKITIEKLNTALDTVQKRCRERTITAQEIMNTLDDITKKLDISKRAMDGVSVEFDLNAQRFPNAYKYTPMSTIVSATYKNGKWTNVQITREQTRRPGKKYCIEHTENSKAALLERFSHFEYAR